MRVAHSAILAVGLFFIPSAVGHAGITSPPIRQPGKAFLDKCGQPSFNSVKGDATGHIEEQEPVKAGCELTLCRGMLFEDQPATNVQRVSPGDSMTMGVDCTIPHGGPANVSLIDTTGGGSGTVIGSFLKTFDDFCPTSGKTPADQAKTQFILPSADIVGDKCQKAGDCVVQLFWATPDFSQNYYYCVDVAMAAAASPPSTPVKPTSTSVVQSTSQFTSSVVEVTSTSSGIAEATVTSSSVEVTSASVESSSSDIIETPVSSSSASSTVIATSVSSDAPVSSADAATSATSASALNDQSAPISASAVQPSGFTTVVVVTNTHTASPTAAGSLKQTSGTRRTKRILWFYI